LICKQAFSRPVSLALHMKRHIAVWTVTKMAWKCSRYFIIVNNTDTVQSYITIIYIFIYMCVYTYIYI
jgi:hypothetical protein